MMKKSNLLLMPGSDAEHADRFRALIEASAQLVWTTAADGHISTDSPSWRAFTGQSLGDWLQLGWLDCVHPDDREGAWAAWGQAIDSGETRELHYRLRHRSGDYRWTVCRVVPVPDQQGGVREWVVTNTDITERKQAEEELRRTTSRLEALIQHAPVGIAMLDSDLRFICVNERSAAVDGVPVEAHLGKTVPEILPALGQKVETLLKQVRDTGEPITGVEIEGETDAAPGTLRHWTASYFPVKCVLGEVIAVGAIALEITERKRAERVLRESEARTRAIINQLPIGVGVADASGQWVLTNSLMAQFVPAAIPSTVPEHRQRWRGWDEQGHLLLPENWPGKRALRGETVVPGLEMLYRTEDGQDVWTRVSAAPLRDERGEIIGATCVVQNIDAQKRAEQGVRDALADTQMLHRLALDMGKPGQPQELYERLMDAAVEVMRSDFASIQVLHPERGQPGGTGELHLLAHRGFPAGATRKTVFGPRRPASTFT